MQTRTKIEASSSTTRTGSVTASVLQLGIFLLSGLSRLKYLISTIAHIQLADLPFPKLGLAISLLVELGCGTVLIFGYRTSLVAGVLAVFTIVTAIDFHHALSDQNQLIHFFKNVAIAGGLLNIVAIGGGSLSVDARRS